MDIQNKEIAETWPSIQNIFSVPHTEQEYLKLVKFLDSLIDEVGNEESHPLSSLMETIGGLIEAYEADNFPDPVHKNPAPSTRSRSFRPSATSTRLRSRNPMTNRIPMDKIPQRRLPVI
jgi:hypothetical protein